MASTPAQPFARAPRQSPSITHATRPAPRPSPRQPSPQVCRPKAGPCDVEERCDATNNACPADAKEPASTVCRAAAGPCDIPERCPGNGDTCPRDMLQSAGTVCRAAKDKCDLPETCTGAGVACPSDAVKEHGYTFKCGLQIFLCAVEPQQLTIGKGNAYALGGCTLGTASMTRDGTNNLIRLDWPACVTQCVNAVCPIFNKGLSNMAFFDCARDTGAWRCIDKVESVTSPTPLPWCPTAHYGWAAAVAP